MFLNYPVLAKDIYDKCHQVYKDGSSWDSVSDSIIESVFNDSLKDAFDSTVLDLGGHNQNAFYNKKLSDLNTGSDERLYLTIKSNVLRLLGRLIENVYNQLAKGHSEEVIIESILKAPVHFKVAPMLNFNSIHGSCNVCGQNNNYYLKDGVISLSPELNSNHLHWDTLDQYQQDFLSHDNNSPTCLYPDGISHSVQFFDVTSDFVVFANNFDDLVGFNIFEAADYIDSKSEKPMSSNSLLGILYSQEYWLNKGVLRVSSNSLPSSIIHHSKTGAIGAVFNHRWNKKSKIKFPVDVTGFRSKGTLPSDLWTVQVVDGLLLEDYAKRCNISFEEAILMYDGIAIKSTPGRYKITTYFQGGYGLQFLMERVET